MRLTWSAHFGTDTYGEFDMKRLLLAISMLVLSVTSFAHGNGSYSGFVVNERTVNLSEIDRREVVEIFLFLRKYWTDSGTKAKVVLPPYGSRSFSKLASIELGQSSITYYESVTGKLHAGTADPIFVATESYVPIKVSQTPYSIGYYYDVS